MKWAWIPAGVLLAMGLVLLAGSVSVLSYLWAIALMLTGVYLAYRALSRQAMR